MRIKELIERLSKHPNPEADIIITFNTGNGDDEELDIKGNNFIEIMAEDDFYENFVELLIHKDPNEDEE